MSAPFASALDSPDDDASEAEPLVLPCGPLAWSGMARSFAHTELAALDLDDARRDARMRDILAALMARPGASLPAVFCDWGQLKAAYRMFDSEALSPEKLLAAHRPQLLARCGEYPEVLALQDTTDLDYPARAGTTGLGPLSYQGRRGVLAHPTYVASTTGVPLGIAALQIWARKDATHGRRKSRPKRLPTAQKESRKWLESFAAAYDLQRALPPHVRLTSIGDREGDLFPLLHAASAAAAADPRGPWLIVRARHDRPCAEREWRREMWAHLAAQAAAGTLTVNVPATKDAPAREATLVLRTAEVTLRQPLKQPKGEPKLGECRVWVVSATEDGRDTADALCWRLATTRPVENAADAQRTVEHYSRRWTIEQFFKNWKAIVKTGDRQLRTAARLKRVMAADALVAWSVQYLSRLYRDQPHLPCTKVFSDVEWKVAWSVAKQEPPPKETPTLGVFVPVFAKLGGHLSRKSDGPVGALVLVRAMQRIGDLVQGYLHARWATQQ